MIRTVASVLLLLGVTLANTIIIPPAETTTGTPIAMIWIHGAKCENSAYETVAQAYIEAGAEKGQKVWVGIPQFKGDVPEPLLMDHYVSETLRKLKRAGFTGDNIFMAAHSLGGVMTQRYAKDHPEIKGSIIMGSVLLRAHHSLNADGTTHFDFPSPVLTLGGTKDGLMRITRVAEAYYHQRQNIEAAQEGMFPVMAIPGGSHMSFMSGYPPSAVLKKDLIPEIEEDAAHALVAQHMANFVAYVVQDADEMFDLTTDDFIAPLVDAMKFEGSYHMKPACYDEALVNRADDPTCGHGAPFVNYYAQIEMAGEFKNDKISLHNDDNFHRVYSVAPVHLPQVNNTCDADTTEDCVLESITVTQNFYGPKDKLDTGYYPISAYEMKVKMSSSQRVQEHAGVDDASFHELDEAGNKCADINQISYDWGVSHASTDARKRYEKLGQKYVMGDDLGPFNEGPLWIWHYMNYTESEDKKTVMIQSPMMRTPTSYPIPSARGFHYCKVLSPFRVIEWIYVDSLYQFDGLAT